MADAHAERTTSQAEERNPSFVPAGSVWLAVGAAAALLLLYVIGALTPAAAILSLTATVVATAVLASRRRVAEPALRSVDRPAGAWPETGIKLFAEVLPDPCFVLDRRGIVRYANSNAPAYFSIRPGDPLTFRLRVPELIAAFERVAKGGPPERVEFSERVPAERWFAAWFASLSDSADFIVLILQDLSEQKRIDRIRVDFVANASHELRTPLASLAGFIETLQGPARDDPAARTRFLAIMHDQATRMSRLIDDLLSLSRIELKAHVRPSGTVDLVAVLHHVRDALEPRARELGVVIEERLPADPVNVTGERDELIQVFENLIENAIKYGQSGKRVVVSLAEPAPRQGPSVSVRDFGPGIAEEYLPRLTERFYRIDVEASRQHRGTGLGLAIVKHILTRHGARLNIESRLGDGATFTVVFAQAEPSAAKESVEKTI